MLLTSNMMLFASNMMLLAHRHSHQAYCHSLNMRVLCSHMLLLHIKHSMKCPQGQAHLQDICEQVWVDREVRDAPHKVCGRASDAQRLALTAQETHNTR